MNKVKKFADLINYLFKSNIFDSSNAIIVQTNANHI